jgi:hypothetical protein
MFTLTVQMWLARVAAVVFCLLCGCNLIAFLWLAPQVTDSFALLVWLCAIIACGVGSVVLARTAADCSKERNRLRRTQALEAARELQHRAKVQERAEWLAAQHQHGAPDFEATMSELRDNSPQASDQVQLQEWVQKSDTTDEEIEARMAALHTVYIQSGGQYGSSIREDNSELPWLQRPGYPTHLTLN